MLGDGVEHAVSDDRLPRLVAAIASQDVKTCVELLDANPMLVNDPIAFGDSGKPQTLLHLVMPGDGCRDSERHLKLVEILLKHGAKVDALGEGPNLGTCTPLTVAAWGGHVTLMKPLIAAGANVDGNRECLQKSPLHSAASHGHTDAVELLVRSGAKCKFCELAMAGWREGVINELQKTPSMINQPNAEGNYPLHEALRTGPGRKLVSLLLQQGADPNTVDAAGRSPLLMAIEQAIWGDQSDTIQQLLTQDSQLDVFVAAGLGELDRLSRLLQENPTAATSKQQDGTTALFHAVVSGNADVAEALLQAGADPTPKSNRFWCCLTPLHLSIQQKHDAITRLLVNHGADINAHGDCTVRWQPTPLHCAARWGNELIIDFLLDQGSDIYVGGEGSVLSWLNNDLLQKLLQRGLNLNHPTCRDLLHRKAADGDMQSVETLLAHGVDVTVTNDQGQRADEIAIANGRVEIAQLLTS